MIHLQATELRVLDDANTGDRPRVPISCARSVEGGDRCNITIVIFKYNLAWAGRHHLAARAGRPSPFGRLAPFFAAASSPAASVRQELAQGAVQVVELRHLGSENFAPLHHGLEQLFVLFLVAALCFQRLSRAGRRRGTMALSPRPRQGCAGCRPCLIAVPSFAVPASAPSPPARAARTRPGLFPFSACLLAASAP